MSWQVDGREAAEARLPQERVCRRLAHLQPDA
jgi:hypothetical protein